MDQAYVFGGKDGKGLRIFSKDEESPLYRLGRLSMFFKDGDDSWLALTSRNIFSGKGLFSFTGEDEDDVKDKVVGKLVRSFSWKEGAKPLDVTDDPKDMIVDEMPVGLVIEDRFPFLVLVRIDPKWMEANKEFFHDRGTWMKVATPDMIQPGTSVQFRV